MLLLFIDFFREWWLLKEPFVSLSVYQRIFLSRSSFKRLIFTLLEQLNTNLQGYLHSSTQLFAVMSTASQFHAYLSAMCDKILQNSRVLTREMTDCFIVFYHFPGTFVNFVVILLICQKFFTCCGFPNNFIDVISLNSRVESIFLLV